MIPLSVALAIGVAVAAVYHFRPLPKQYRNRKNQSRQWHDAFPTATQAQIGEFLSIVAAAFGLPHRDRLRFSPTDGVMELYHATHKSTPTKVPQGADTMELEHFFIDLSHKYDREIPPTLVSPDTTLDQVFRFVTAPKA